MTPQNIRATLSAQAQQLRKSGRTTEEIQQLLASSNREVDHDKRLTDPELEALIQEAWAAGRLRDGVERLAALPADVYEARRKAEAEALGVRIGWLDQEVKKTRGSGEVSSVTQGQGVWHQDLEPWADPVEGVDVLDALAATFRRFLALPRGAAEALALWSLHAHAFDAATVSPRLAIVSPEKRCGKSTLLTILGALVPRPLSTSNITAAAVFRTIEAARPTLLIDEADTFLRGSDELRGILNSGHSRSNAYVVRCVGEESEPRKFGTWAPTVVALIGRLPGTLEDRSVRIPMRRRAPGEKVEQFRVDRQGEMLPLARKAARWAKDQVDGLKKSDPSIPPALHDRAADNWRPLLAIADAAGGNWPGLARDAARLLTVETEVEPPVGELLLSDIRDIFSRLRIDRIPSEDLCGHLVALEERPWGEWKRGREITPAQLGRLLTPFGIQSRSIRMPDGKTPKGYPFLEFEDAFRRYIPPGETPQRHNAEGREIRTESVVGASGNAPPPPCGGVADPDSGDPEEEEFLRRERDAIQEEGMG